MVSKCMSLADMEKLYRADQRKNGKRYAYEFEIVKAWLADEHRVIPSRYDGLGTYLFQQGEVIKLDYTWSTSEPGKFCDADKLMDEGFIIVPDDYKIRVNQKCPDWFIRTRKKSV